MPRGISTTALTQAGVENVFYTELVTVDIPGQETIYLTPMQAVSGTTALSFGGHAYQSWYIERSERKATSDTQVSPLTIRFQNIDQQFGAILETNQIRGSFVTISGVFLASGTNAPVTQDGADLIPVANGRVGAIEVDDSWVILTVNPPIRDIRTVVPRRTYSREHGFNFTPVTE